VTEHFVLYHRRVVEHEGAFDGNGGNLRVNNNQLYACFCNEDPPQRVDERRVHTDQVKLHAQIRHFDDFDGSGLLERLDGPWRLPTECMVRNVRTGNLRGLSIKAGRAL
jgi:hypothetical protein